VNLQPIRWEAAGTYRAAWQGCKDIFASVASKQRSGIAPGDITLGQTEVA